MSKYKMCVDRQRKQYNKINLLALQMGIYISDIAKNLTQKSFERSIEVRQFARSKKLIKKAIQFCI